MSTALESFAQLVFIIPNTLITWLGVNNNHGSVSLCLIMYILMIILGLHYLSGYPTRHKHCNSFIDWIIEKLKFLVMIVSIIQSMFIIIVITLALCESITQFVYTYPTPFWFFINRLIPSILAICILYQLYLMDCDKSIESDNLKGLFYAISCTCVIALFLVYTAWFMIGIIICLVVRLLITEIGVD